MERSESGVLSNVYQSASARALTADKEIHTYQMSGCFFPSTLNIIFITKELLDHYIL